jgi:hypothetical protein
MQTRSTEQNLRFALATLLLLTLSGCGSLTGIGATKATNSTVCNVWRPIGWSKKDTDQTIAEIKVNNARQEGWCFGGK